MSTTQEAAQFDVVGEEDVPLKDRIAEAVRRRGAMKGVLTQHINHIDKLTSDHKNIQQVKEKLSVFPESIENFEEAHAELVRLLPNEELSSEEESYKVAVITRAMDLQDLQ